MFQLTTLDNYRYGIFSFGEKKIKTPALLTSNKDCLFLEDISIQKPKGILENRVASDLKTAPLLRIPFRLPFSISQKMTEENITIVKEETFDCVPLSITMHKELNERFFENLPEVTLFFFPRYEEKALIENFVRLRKVFPSSLFFARCMPHEIPIYLLLGFDLFNYTEENREVLQTFKKNSTKHFVEKEANASIHTKRLLRIMYSLYEEFELYTKNKIEKEIYISYDSLFRPETERFRRTVAERYFPSTNIFILLPCSARKPYSASSSHIKFMSALRRGAGKYYSSLTQLILTSPLGVVPRELEDIIDYDTVVTGFWSEEEILCARKILKVILSKSKNPKIIAHLPEEYKGICEGLDEIVFSCNGNPTSSSSLEKLSEIVRDSISHDTKNRDLQKDKVRKISNYMFKEDIFPQDFFLRGKWIKQIVAEDKILATWSRFLFPTIEGAQNMNHYWIDIDFDLRGDVFCSGIIDADEDIRAGDIVCVRKNGEVCGVGKALLPAYFMKKMKHGKAVSVKHKR